MVTIAYLSAYGTAKRLGVSPAWIGRLAGKGRIKGAVFGETPSGKYKGWKIPVDALLPPSLPTGRRKHKNA